MVLHIVKLISKLHFLIVMFVRISSMIKSHKRWAKNIMKIVLVALNVVKNLTVFNITNMKENHIVKITITTNTTCCAFIAINQFMIGNASLLEKKRYHVQHFQCNKCNKNLNQQPYKLKNEEIWCKECNLIYNE